MRCFVLLVLCKLVLPASAFVPSAGALSTPLAGAFLHSKTGRAPAAAAAATPPPLSSRGRVSSSLSNCREVTGAELEIELGEWDTPIILDVFAIWCGPCKLMEPEMNKVATELEGKVRVLKMNSDEEPAISSALRVQGLPSLLFLKGGGIVYRMEGALPASDILKIADVVFNAPPPTPPSNAADPESPADSPPAAT